MRQQPTAATTAAAAAKFMFTKGGHCCIIDRCKAQNGFTLFDTELYSHLYQLAPKQSGHLTQAASWPASQPLQQLATSTAAEEGRAKQARNVIVLPTSM